MTCELLTIKEVAKLLNIGETSIYLKLNPKYEQYDPSFPKPIKVGLKANRWTRQAIENWVFSLSNGGNRQVSH
ncbi:AlpA family transcriptional regulator [Pelistega indica]|uniref:AlpA family transcriptional regulator n=1 Tax=Pelistega indica TaxID=1414851 RepID=V8G8U0_9BURK|nr:AlpA family phage regulatory protein [Pelistega indica]ETD72840.1 AlpA family transcriptional regulator [Pelistega indica]